MASARFDEMLYLTLFYQEVFSSMVIAKKIFGSMNVHSDAHSKKIESNNPFGSGSRKTASLCLE